MIAEDKTRRQLFDFPVVRSKRLPPLAQEFVTENVTSYRIFSILSDHHFKHAFFVTVETFEASS